MSTKPKQTKRYTPSALNLGPRHDGYTEGYAEGYRDAMTGRPDQPIPGELSIQSYMHCKECIAEKPGNISARDWADISVGFTKLGVQLWCNRHNRNICHIDFQGQKHPANIL